MIYWLAGAWIVIGFVLLLHWFRTIEFGLEAIELSKAAGGVLTDSNLDDLEKEKAVQKYAIKLFARSFYVFLGGAAAFILPFGAVWLLAQFHLIDLEGVISTTTQWDFLLVSAIGGTFLFIFLRKKFRA